jgi:hypothetical protein
MSVQKRQRERKKAEKAELKRETRRQSVGSAEREPGTQVAGRDDLEGYGVVVAPGSDPEEA